MQFRFLEYDAAKWTLVLPQEEFKFVEKGIVSSECRDFLRKSLVLVVLAWMRVRSLVNLFEIMSNCSTTSVFCEKNMVV